MVVARACNRAVSAETTAARPFFGSAFHWDLISASKHGWVGFSRSERVPRPLLNFSSMDSTSGELSAGTGVTELGGCGQSSEFVSSFSFAVVVAAFFFLFFFFFFFFFSFFGVSALRSFLTWAM